MKISTSKIILLCPNIAFGHPERIHKSPHKDYGNDENMNQPTPNIGGGLGCPIGAFVT
ncbi:MAG: hypothetical protein SVR08_14395 [Spirochaetota bacterium]|nr:hypothetical protein [Spirochaetota bacterium]